MKLFSIFKKKEVKIERPKLSDKQLIMKNNAIRLHKIRIENLNSELHKLSEKLELVESNFDASTTKREKESDTIIRRMSLLKYEIEIRGELVKWLS